MYFESGFLKEYNEICKSRKSLELSTIVKDTN